MQISVIIILEGSNDMKKKKKKKRLRLRYEAIKFLTYFIFFIWFIIYGINGGIKVYKEIQYKKTDEYKINTLGYTMDETKTILNLSEDKIEYFKNHEYNELYYEIITSKYYLNKNFYKYLEYKEYHEDEELSKIIAYVNIHASTGWYNTSYATDLSKGYLILVNKFYHLSSDYSRGDLTNASLSYAYSDNKAAEIVLENFEKMRSDVEDALDVRLMINSSYRSYADQEEVYNSFKKVSQKYADSYAARPGYSEHQTGLAIDITSLEHPGATAFTASEEYTWLKENCYKYGFILRYPEGKEDLTGYSNESWHFRYVGEKAAKTIYEEDITFDEYYAYYVEGDEEISPE